jgi:hypothetical protein
MIFIDLSFEEFLTPTIHHFLLTQNFNPTAVQFLLKPHSRFSCLMIPNKVIYSYVVLYDSPSVGSKIYP